MLQPDRPKMPEGYGIKAANEGRMVSWSEVERKLEEARNYWIVTASPESRPHAVPVWGIWFGGTLYFGTDTKSRSGQNLAANHRIVVHLESGDDVVILEGRAHGLRPEEVTEELDGAYHTKYGWRLKDNPVFRLEMHTALAWAEHDFTESATRWRFRR